MTPFRRPLPRADWSAGLLLFALLAVEPWISFPAHADPKPDMSAGAPSGDRFDPREAYRAIARREARRLDIPYALIDAVMAVESGYDPLAGGKAGEVGLMQVMPQTARMMGFSGSLAELSNPQTNIHLGARYLAGAFRLAEGDVCTTVMKYRAGHQETRFSARSVAYCLRIRRHLVALGVPVTGEVPKPTFGFEADVTRMGVAIGSVGAARRLARGIRLHSRIGWSAYTARIRALDRAAAGITIAH